MEFNLAYMVCLLLMIIVSVEGRYGRGRSRRHNNNWYPKTPRIADDSDETKVDEPYLHDLPRRSGHGDQSADNSSHLALYVVLCVLAGVLVILVATTLLLKIYKAATVKRRRTTPVTIPVKPAVALPQRIQPISKPKPPAQKKNQEPNIFTVTPVLPSYSDVTKDAETNRPPPGYSVHEPSYGSGYLRSFASPPPPYMPNGPQAGDVGRSRGPDNVRYTGRSSSVDFVLGTS